MPDRGTILIVDDEPVNVELLVALLRADFKIETATSGAEALELAEIVKPDLILLDVMMPTMDGFEVCTRLKVNAGTAEIPVILITARSDAEAEARGLELGASDYVTEPINPPIMLARVRNHVAFKKARDALAASALVDGLTGIANRRRFDEALAVECGRVNRHAGLLSLILFDLDNFKALNDTWGHLAGDECLKKVGVVARAALHRSADIVARYGGEEFVCILPETDAEGALFIADAIRQGIAALEMPHPGLHVTASFGVCTVDCRRGIAPTDLIAAADRCLYQAKVAGRNRVVRVEPKEIGNTDPLIRSSMPSRTAQTSSVVNEASAIHTLMQHLPGEGGPGAAEPPDYRLHPFTSDDFAIDEDVEVEETPDERVDEASTACEICV